MKRNFVKFITLILVFAFVLSGCQQNQNPETSETSEETIEESKNPFEDIPESPINDFEFNDMADGTVALTKYLAGEETVKIPKTVDGKQVSHIAMMAFMYNQKIVNVIIPEGVKLIDNQSFAYCGELKTVVLPESLEEIENSTFEQCKKLENINFPKGLQRIGSEAFKDCVSLKTVTIPPNAFDDTDGCFLSSGVETVILSEGIETIPYCAFYNAKVKEVVLPSTCKSVGYIAFGNCPLEKIVLNDGLETIAKYAFGGEAKIKEITIPASVTEVHASSFWGKLEKMIFLGDAPETFDTTVYREDNDDFYTIYYNESAKGFSFPRWHGFATRIIGSDKEPLVKDELEYFENSDGTITVSCYLGNEDSVVLPNQIDGKDVTVIGEAAFQFKKLNSITMPDTVREIGVEAFSYCENLKTVNWSKNLKTIEKEAFCCSGIVTLNLPEGLEVLGEEAFGVCRELTEVNFPASLKTVGESAFTNCSSLKSVVIPATVESWGLGAFSFCGLESVEIQEGITEISDYMFTANKLKTLNLPSTLKVIGISAFDGGRFESLILPDGLVSIGERAFEECRYLKEITIPDSVTTMHEFSFNLCTGMESMWFEGNAPEIIDDPDWDNRNCDYIVYYHEGAKGFDGEYWREFYPTVW